MATRLKIKTTEGDITIRLYDETPKHRDNFLKLVKEEYSTEQSSPSNKGFHDTRRRS